MIAVICSPFLHSQYLLSIDNCQDVFRDRETLVTSANYPTTHDRRSGRWAKSANPSTRRQKRRGEKTEGLDWVDWRQPNRVGV